ncbi:MAG TPA: bifunctional UDP-3-O-[3-hydroxymyristoyl] N-acetylglucosamine deacetylase/3-hydroxyacyl-ACP dehydratase [Chthoniobacterales bacterium]
MPSAPEMQQTLAKSVEMSGVSLHTGEKVTLRLQAAPADHGIKFKRTDLRDEPTIDAKIENLKTVERATTIGEGAMRVHTVEHVLSALTGMGVDNALIEMNANEPPIGDGSARPYVELIKKAGVAPQEARRRTFVVREPIHIETKGGSVLVVLPDEKFRISCTQAGPDGRWAQFFATEITPAIYEREIAPARTFVFYEDVEPLIEKNLIKGGSLENAIVIRGEAVLSKEPLRFADEFVRHKILDIVGDLALCGSRIQGHVVAVKPGHGPNAELARALVREHAKSLPALEPRVAIKGEGALDINEVMKILPHRYPFLLVDRILGFDGDTKITGIKSVTINEPFFQGHFPGHPVMPGVLQLEAMAQVASVLMMKVTQQASRLGYFVSADEVKFRKPVFPGDTLVIHAELLRARSSRIGKARCRCTVNDKVVSEGDLMFTFLDQ